ncbi:MAG: DUF1963 domain-containing protein [bacterium]|nr:DUF1963 domain-containing protein [bacterium]
MVVESELAEHGEYLRRVVRPAVDIVKSESGVCLGGSRFGGAPDLPVGSQWPTHELGPYRFLGQINFAEVPPIETVLPTSGLLSIFVKDDPDGESDWEDPGYIQALLIPDSFELESLDIPEEVDFGTAKPIAFHPTVDIPYDEAQSNDWPFNEDELDIYEEMRQSLHRSEDYLLGYPSHCTLGYDPAPGPGWLSLLTVHSNDELEWCWHDGDKLMVFIETNLLKDQDFYTLVADAG